jgi:hypothetical protein
MFTPLGDLDWIATSFDTPGPSLEVLTSFYFTAEALDFPRSSAVPVDRLQGEYHPMQNSSATQEPNLLQGVTLSDLELHFLDQYLLTSTFNHDTSSMSSLVAPGTGSNDAWSGSLSSTINGRVDNAVLDLPQGLDVEHGTPRITVPSSICCIHVNYVWSSLLPCTGIIHESSYGHSVDIEPLCGVDTNHSISQVMPSSFCFAEGDSQPDRSTGGSTEVEMTSSCSQPRKRNPR